MKKERIVYFEYLRFFAIVAVVIIHVAAQNIYNVNIDSLEWTVFNIYDSLVRWGVPVFLMISGALFLSREIETKRLYSKYIARLGIAYCGWSLFYAIAVPICEYLVHKDLSTLYKGIASSLINGTYHLWFLPMIIGLYMCVPFLRQISKSRNASRYFLLLSFIFAFIIPLIINLASQFGGNAMRGYIAITCRFLSDMKMDVVMGYAFYFVLGHQLNNTEMSKKQRSIVYVLGALGFVATVVMTTLATQKAQSLCTMYYDYFSLTVALEAIAVHTWFKYRKLNNEKLNGVVFQLAKCSFGAYLVHVFVLKALQIMGLTTATFSSILSVPIISLIVLAVSFLFSFVVDKIRELMGRTRRRNKEKGEC